MNYEALCVYAGRYLREPMPIPIAVGQGEPLPDIPVAVYIAVDMSGAVLYVGSVARPTDPTGAQSRLDEHLREHDRLATWDQLFLIPLLADTPLDEVRRIEGRVGAHLAPEKNRALPRLRRRR